MELSQNVQFPVLGVEEEGVYSRCLFKQISVNELESELKNRNIIFLPADSYHILTLKLKLSILETSESLPSVRKDLEDEINKYYGGGGGGGGGGDERQNITYKCCLVGCKFIARNHKNYVRHLHFHDSFPHNVICQLRGCQREFSNVIMLKMHIKTIHRTTRRISTVFLRQNQLVEELTKLRCQQPECGHQAVNTLLDLKKHLKSHTDKRDMVCCPFSGCSYETNVSGSLKSHLSRKHHLQQVQSLKSDIIYDASTSSDVAEVATEASTVLDAATGEDISDKFVGHYEESEDSIDLEEEGFLDEETFVKSLSIVFNNWMNVAAIPYSTVNLIVREVFKSYQMGANLAKHRIKNILHGQGFDEQQVEEIFENVDKNDPFEAARAHLESEKKRLTFIKESFSNVKPETIRLNPINETKPESYQYVSLKSSIKTLLEDDSYQRQKKSDPYKAEEGIVKDVRDGEIFKQNQYFKDNPDSVPIIMFQDELEEKLQIFLPFIFNKVDISSSYRLYCINNVQS